MKRYAGTELFVSKKRYMAAVREFYPKGWDRAQRTLGTPQSRVRRALGRVGTYQGPLLPNAYKEAGTY